MRSSVVFVTPNRCKTRRVNGRRFQPSGAVVHGEEISVRFPAAQSFRGERLRSREKAACGWWTPGSARILRYGHTLNSPRRFRCPGLRKRPNLPTSTVQFPSSSLDNESTREFRWQFFPDQPAGDDGLAAGELTSRFTRTRVGGQHQAARSLRFFAEVWNMRKRR